MKIGILTLPLEFNYGGLIQAWALQKTLVGMGHTAIIINRVPCFKTNQKPRWHKLLSFLKNEIYVYIGKRERNPLNPEELKEYAKKNVIEFINNKYKGISFDIKTDTELIEYIDREKFEAFIVGSDQVWRPKYTPILMTYFLDFAKDIDKVKKIAYAASFGVDDWEYDKKQTIEASELAKRFDLITVRESSGVELVKNHFNCEAVQVLDPTLLIDKEDYINLIKKTSCSIHDSSGDLFCYVLDKSSAVSLAINRCSTITKYKPFFCNYQTIYYQIQKRSQKHECMVPPVEQWLKSFDDAKMVITDSFHGTVFSIIFNKPFWVITNEERGAERFKSLLTQFKLEDRIISDINNIDWEKPILWDSVNSIRSELIAYSISLLSSAL